MGRGIGSSARHTGHRESRANRSQSVRTRLPMQGMFDGTKSWFGAGPQRVRFQHHQFQPRPPPKPIRLLVQCNYCSWFSGILRTTNELPNIRRCVLCILHHMCFRHVDFHFRSIHRVYRKPSEPLTFQVRPVLSR